MKTWKLIWAAASALMLLPGMAVFAADKTITLYAEDYGFSEESVAPLAVAFTHVNNAQDVYYEIRDKDSGGLFKTTSITLDSGGTLTLPGDYRVYISNFPYTLTTETTKDMGTRIEPVSKDNPAPRVELNGLPMVGSADGVEAYPAKGSVIRFCDPGQYSVSLSYQKAEYESVYFRALITVSGNSVSANAYTVPASAAKITVDGKPVACQAYTISDNNFFKLRDVAAMLNGTVKQFSVDYDAATNGVMLKSGQAYAPNGSELAMGDGAAKAARYSYSTIQMTAKYGTSALAGMAFEIEGSNYFRMRDLGTALGFSVEWDQATGTIVIDTSKSY